MARPPTPGSEAAHELQSGDVEFQQTSSISATIAPAQVDFNSRHQPGNMVHVGEPNSPGLKRRTSVGVETGQMDHAGGV